MFVVSLFDLAPTPRLEQEGLEATIRPSAPVVVLDQFETSLVFSFLSPPTIPTKLRFVVVVNIRIGDKLVGQAF